MAGRKEKGLGLGYRVSGHGRFMKKLDTLLDVFRGFACLAWYLVDRPDA